MAKKFTHRDLTRLFHNVAAVMGWNTSWWNEEGRVRINAVRLDYYFYGGGWNIVRATSEGGAEGHLVFSQRLTTPQMRRALEAMAWTRGYTLAEKKCLDTGWPNHLPGTYEYFTGAQAAHMSDNVGKA